MLNRNKDGDIRHISDLSLVFLEAMKEIASRGKDFSRSEITATLSNRADVKSLMEHVNVSRGTQAPRRIAGSAGGKTADSETEESKAPPVKELQQTITRERDFHKRMTLTLLKLCKVDGNERYFDMLDTFNERLGNDADVAHMEQLLADLKNHMLRGDSASREEQNTPKTFLSRLRPKRRDVDIEHVKKCYFELLAELKRIIDGDSVTELETIAEGITASEDVEFVLSQRTAVVAVLEKFASRIDSERANVTRFIKELGEKLVNLEKNLETATGTAATYQREDEHFNKNLEQELREVKDAVGDTDDIEELRSMIFHRLDRVTTLLLEKRKDDQERIKRTERERDNLLKSIDTVISDLREQNQLLEEQNRIDPLTGISNRRDFEERLNEELERYHRYSTLFSVMFFDIDHFKKVNDKYGHTAGDRALRGIAQCAAGALRKTDMLARYGGEEFVIILPETPLEKATQVAQKLHQLIRDTEFEYDGNTVPITISVGVTEVHESDTSLGSILDRADKNTYRAKERGRNKVISDND